MDNTFDTIKPIIAKALGVPVEVITPALAASDIEQWDSMGNMAVIASLEENLGIEFPLDDLFDLNSVSSLIEEINKLTE